MRLENLLYPQETGDPFDLPGNIPDCHIHHGNQPEWIIPLMFIAINIRSVPAAGALSRLVRSAKYNQPCRWMDILPMNEPIPFQPDRMNWSPAATVFCYQQIF
jgi:hypothetical protein